MFPVNIIRRVFRKTSIDFLQPTRRSLMSKKKSRMENIFSRLNETPEFEKIQNSKITPKDYKIIYVTPMFWTLILCYCSLPTFWGLFYYDLYSFYTREDYLEKFQKNIKNFSLKDKLIQIGFTFFLLVSLQILPSRVVVASFRKGNEFQTLRYGLLGPVTKKYVHHGFQAMEPTKYKGIYSLKGKKVFVLSNGFRNYEDFYSVIKLDMN